MIQGILNLFFVISKNYRIFHFPDLGYLALPFIPETDNILYAK